MRCSQAKLALPCGGVPIDFVIYHIDYLPYEMLRPI